MKGANMFDSGFFSKYTPFYVPFILLLGVIIFFVVIGCKEVNTTVEAKVLSVDDHILEGYMIGHFLGGSDGKIANDVIKVGVQFTYDNQLYLVDLRLNRAQLVYYKDRTTLPILIQDRRISCDGQLNLYLDKAYVGHVGGLIEGPYK